MSVDLQEIRKCYKSDYNIKQEMLTTLEQGLDIDRAWNGKYTFLHCWDCHGKVIGHRLDKC